MRCDRRHEGGNLQEEGENDIPKQGETSRMCLRKSEALDEVERNILVQRLG